MSNERLVIFVVAVPFRFKVPLLLIDTTGTLVVPFKFSTPVPFIFSTPADRVPVRVVEPVAVTLSVPVPVTPAFCTSTLPPASESEFASVALPVAP